MMDLAEAKRILSAFADAKVEYVVVGSIAMAAHGLIRATRDIDFFVSPTPENVACLRQALRSLYDDSSVDEITAEDLGGAYPAVEYTPPHGDYKMDILARLGEAFSYADIEAQEVDLDGLRVRVATPRMLVKMKKDTVRPQDRLDAETLRQWFQIEEER